MHSYFIYHCEVPVRTASMITADLKLDTNLLKVVTVPKAAPIPADYVCTLDEEMQPPPFRKSVHELLEKGRRFQKPRDPCFDEM